MIRTSLLAVASLGVLALPMAASADTSDDPALAAFQAVCVAHANNYSGALDAAKAAGFTDTQLIPPTDDSMSITSTQAREKVVGTEHLTLLLQQGLRHLKSGDISEADCKISTDQADNGVRERTKSWLGFGPDSSDDALSTFYVKTGPQPEHIAQSGLNAALAAGGFSVIKAQQDPASATLVYTTFSK
ncbi:MAG TPA: hypothetical protein VME40_08855 [Caulobacteraceae bacterium]|nr:hypothetical protein [Caulobacteraceae bacterium]